MTHLYPDTKVLHIHALELLEKQFGQRNATTLSISTAKKECDIHCVPVLKNYGAGEITGT